MSDDAFHIKLTKQDRKWLHQTVKNIIDPKQPRNAAHKILRELVEGVDATFGPHILYGLSYDDICQIRRGKDYRREYQRLKTILMRMKKRRLIDIREREGKLWVELTDKGAAEALRNEILRCEKKLPEGTLCYVAFDFPQAVRKLRDSFRRFLKQAGFTMSQLSIWKTNKDAAELVRLFVKRSDAARWVTVIVGKEE